MPVLSSSQRKTLEDACTKGRRASEQAVRAALTTLAIASERPPAHLSESDRQLRRGLRAKARQLGDKSDDVNLLVAECAYEQWHRLLFARFLAENNLLLHPEFHAPVTLADCEDLSESLGEPDGWSVAASFAAEILPGIFRLDDPCVRLRLAPEGRLALEDILAGLPVEVLLADDALGWVYQFWQKDRKDEVNSSERKIGGADLGPVTQLFTENYMVRFLLENSLGAWWASRRPDSPLLKSFEYLQFTEVGESTADVFGGWPDVAAEVTVMDPCCGSGHFLVEGFEMLWRMRAEEEELDDIAAQDAVLRDNLFGLELDPRCVQIAMFSLALQSWKAGGGWRELPVPNVACSGVPATAATKDWVALAGGRPNLENALARLHPLFSEADTLGSLIEPRRATEDLNRTQSSFYDVEWDEVAPLLAKALEEETEDPATAVLGADAIGLVRAADYLARKYTLVATNVPYLLRGHQSNVLRNFLEDRYPLGQADLATAFYERISQGLAHTIALVMPQSWTALNAYRRLRQKVLETQSFVTVARLGAGAFSGISGEIVQAVLQVSMATPPPQGWSFIGIDAAGRRSTTEIATELRRAGNQVVQASLLANPEARLILGELQTHAGLKDFADIAIGLHVGDDIRYRRQFWEVSSDEPWRRFQLSAEVDGSVSGFDSVIWWPEDGRTHRENPNARVQGDRVWNKVGVAIRLVRPHPVSPYWGDLFGQNVAAVIPSDPADIAGLWHFLQSEDFRAQVAAIDGSLKVTPSVFGAVPCDIESWRQLARQLGPVPEPRSNDPTQWLFEGSPELSTAVLHVAVARLVGYSWPDQPESDDLQALTDADGIVCLSSVAGEAPAHDRLQEVLAASFGPSWSPAKQQELLEATGSKKKTLVDWLRDDFFKQHCKLFGNRPFIWHLWDGQRDGFAALLNIHRLDRKTLEKLTYTYLGDWIERQRAETRDETAGAEARLAAALKLRSGLELVLDGEPPHDIYVRWKSLAEQPIGWDPDLNDGVRVNVRPFVEAGVLRSSFNIHWRKDRGRDSDGSERLNDLHLTTAEKRAARGESA